MMSVYIGGLLPEGITLSDAQINLVASALQPYVKTALTNASGSFADYLTGTNPNFSVEIAIAPAMPTVKTVTGTPLRHNCRPDSRVCRRRISIML